MTQYDVVVVGSGAAGLTAALRAAAAGLSVLVLEKAAHFGGTTAISGGGIWVPGSPQAQAAGVDDSAAVARQYVLDVIGPSADPALIDAYLDAAPAMVAWLENNSAVRFLLSPPSSDWYPDIAGSADHGRLLSPQEYDGKKLGAHFADLRPAREEFNAPGGFMIDLFDLPYLAEMPSPKSLFHFGKLAAKFGADKLRRYPRGTRLTMGNALVARLLRSALDAGITLRKYAAVDRLLVADGRVTGVRVGGEDIAANVGVLLAAGGFSASEQLRKAYIPYAEDHVSILPYENTGDGMNMGLEAGASLDGDNLVNAVWAVVSTMTRPDGYVARYAHLIDMSKPGCIAVNGKGERFGNEASVHFVEAMHATGTVPAHIIGDAHCVKTYGMGMVLPGGGGLKKLIAAGYVIEAPTLRALADKIGVDGDGLLATVAKMNRYAETGRDPDFGKGDTQIDIEIGDPKHKPNPCLGRVEKAPFYAIKIHPGDGSTTVGLKIDAHCRVIGTGGAPVAGLYAAGLDANSIWRGKSPAHGCNVGPAMVTGYIAGQAMAEALVPV
ncbi:FAD-dependent oxidoreductase [Sphingobium sp. SA2]|uniref:FAD-dependent oxidoreductase n=1 Tax=unclassified Sphingobium TaxID=2611147 RepID=UPI000505B9D7|nr:MULTISPECIES: FAD-dependent oxidoreductase [unclassified Sphingobium]KFL44682.1 putative dehydrogenase [Sphingobium sp. ba1]MDT7532880.1 FAD-dependent oxidoreductase [Sphingobium sp. SA2]|tara:strand:- start:4310 stop:5965 length:1656 start_codon:yes stop_codon:yes gene_type:complete